MDYKIIFGAISKCWHLPKPHTAPSRVEGFTSSVTHYKIKNDLLGNYYQGTLMFSDNATQEFYGLKDKKKIYIYLGYTYKESCTHDKEPPPTSIIKFQLQTESKS